MNKVGYYVLGKGQQFEVFREHVSKGSSTIRSRAVDLAATLARLETRFTGTPTEVHVEQADGVRTLHSQFHPPSLQEARGHVVQIGSEQVLLR